MGDQIIEEANENCRMTIEANSVRILTESFIISSPFMVGTCMFTLSLLVICLELDTSLADIKTEDDLQKLSRRQMKAVLGKIGVKVGEELDQEELRQRLRPQLWGHGERTPCPVPVVPVKYTKAD